MNTEELKEEAAVVEELQAEAPAVEDLAAHDYKMLLPTFFEKLEKFSGSKLKRVFGALVEYPFEISEVNLSYAEERELFLLAMKINDCKFVMMRAALDMKKDEIQALWEDLEKKKEQTDAVQG